MNQIMFNLLLIATAASGIVLLERLWMGESLWQYLRDRCRERAERLMEYRTLWATQARKDATGANDATLGQKPAAHPVLPADKRGTESGQSSTEPSASPKKEGNS